MSFGTHTHTMFRGESLEFLLLDTPGGFPEGR